MNHTQQIILKNESKKIKTFKYHFQTAKITFIIFLTYFFLKTLFFNTYKTVLILCNVLLQKYGFKHNQVTICNYIANSK